VITPRPEGVPAPGPWSFHDHDLDALLDLFARGAKGPGAGSLTALVTAAAAALLTRAARLSSPAWDAGSAAAAQAEKLRSRATPLVQVGADAYAAALEQLETGPCDLQERRDFTLGRALVEAAMVPLAIAEIAADTVELAVYVAEHGNPDLRPDAIGAAILAEAACRAAVHLVEINLAVGSDEEHVRRGAEAIAAAADSLRRALAAVS